MLNSGVYKITNLANGKIYIGSSFSLTKRLYEHRRSLARGTHRNKHLQSAYDFAKGLFKFEVVLLAVGKEYVLEMEKKLILAYQSHIRENGYNKSTETHANLLGYKHGPEFCAAIGRSKIGNKNRLGAVIPQEMRDRISAKLKGRVPTDEQRRKMSETRKGVPQRPEWIAKRTASVQATKERKRLLAEQLKGQ